MRSILLATCLMAALLPATVQPVAAEEGAELPAPKISTIMQQQQLRHIKLWFAGRAGNWPLADYEIDALKDGFDELNEQLGGETVAKEVGAQICRPREGDRRQGPHRIYHRLRRPHGRLQQLSSCARSRFHSHPEADLVAL